MKYFIIFLMLIFLISFTTAGFAQIPGNEIIHGNYTNEEFGFSVVLPDSLDGFLTEFDNPSVGKTLNFQIHPEMGNEICCPSIDSSPIVFLFDNNPKTFYSIPVPMTGGILASFQGYGMTVKTENLGEYPVLTSTLNSERDVREFPEPVKRVGKFYFINTGDRYISYGIWASEENYEKYLETFESSAKSLTTKNVIPINLHELFPDKNFQAELRLEDNSSIFPKIITPSTVTSLIATQSSKSLQISFKEPNNFRSFLAINIGDLLEGPYEITFNDEPVDSQILENESGEYLIIFYSGQGQHNIRILGSSVNSISNPPYQIEKINNTLYYVSESLELNPDLMDKIIFQDVVFTPTFTYDPPREMHSYIMNSYGEKEIISVYSDEPTFNEKAIPQVAGIVGRSDGYHLLVSVNLKEISPLKQIKSGLSIDEIQCRDSLIFVTKHDGTPACVKPESTSKLIKRNWIEIQFSFCGVDGLDSKGNLNKNNSTHRWNGDECKWIVYSVPEFSNGDSLHPDDRLQIKHSAGHTTVYITLSSWDEYYEWEKNRGSEHDAMPPIIIDDSNINPIVLDLLNELWTFENYDVSRHDNNLFTKIIQKDYSVSNHIGINDWLESEYKKQFGESKDGFSNYFEYHDDVYIATMLVAN